MATYTTAGLTADDLVRFIDYPTDRVLVSASELACAFLDRIAQLDGTFGAVLLPTPEVARIDAARADTARRRGEPLPLDGMPIVIKDNIDVAGCPTTAASRAIGDRRPAEDAEAVGRLRRAGAVIVGKAALHELAFGVTCQSEWFPSTRNPWDARRIAGGSSGGSAAALAADFCIGALGTDTGGSIRVPAALTGVTGLRPSTGSVPSTGLVRTCPSFDTIGPMARGAADTRRLLAALRDPSGSPPAQRLPSPTAVRGLRLGLIDGAAVACVDADILELTRHIGNVLEQLGATVVQTAVPDFSPCEAPLARILRYEAFQQHRARLSEDPSRFGRDVRRRLELGQLISPEQLASSWAAVRAWRATAQAALAGLDGFILPTTPQPAPVIGDGDMITTTGRLTRLTAPLSVLGLPAVSLPCGLTSDGLPAGVQLACRAGDDDLALVLAEAIQSKTQFHRMRAPGLAAPDIASA